MGSPFYPILFNFYINFIDLCFFFNVQYQEAKNKLSRIKNSSYLYTIKNPRRNKNNKETFKERSAILFCYEIMNINKIPFLDVLMDPDSRNFLPSYNML